MPGENPDPYVVMAAEEPSSFRVLDSALSTEQVSGRYLLKLIRSNSVFQQYQESFVELVINCKRKTSYALRPLLMPFFRYFHGPVSTFPPIAKQKNSMKPEWKNNAFLYITDPSQASVSFTVMDKDMFKV